MFNLAGVLVTLRTLEVFCGFSISQGALMPESFFSCSIFFSQLSLAVVLSLLPASNILGAISVEHASFTVWLVKSDLARVLITGRAFQVSCGFSFG